MCEKWSGESSWNPSQQFGRMIGARVAGHRAGRPARAQRVGGRKGVGRSRRDEVVWMRSARLPREDDRVVLRGVAELARRNPARSGGEGPRSREGDRGEREGGEPLHSDQSASIVYAFWPYCSSMSSA